MGKESVDQLIIAEIKEGVGLITLNRPEALNAINIALAAELQTALDGMANDASVRVILLKAAGKHFCAGGDVKWFAELGDNLSQGLEEILDILNPILLQLLNLPIPVVTAIQGMTAGAGVGLALAGDIVLAAESARLLSSYAAIGLSPDVGAAYSLARRVGPSRAKEFFFSNRPLDAVTCMAWGVVNSVYPDDRLAEEAGRFAKDMAQAPTQALGFAKQLVDRAWKTTIEEQLALEREFMASCGRSHDGQEGVQAFLKKRKPLFTGNRT